MAKQKDFYQVSLKVILKNQDGRILALKADSKGSLAGYYDLPGGRIDDDEFTVPFEQIAARELREELGSVKFELNPKPAALGRHLIPASMSGVEKELHVLYVFFEAELLGGEIMSSNEHEGVRWVDPAAQPLEQLFTSGHLQGLKMYLEK